MKNTQGKVKKCNTFSSWALPAYFSSPFQCERQPTTNVQITHARCYVGYDSYIDYTSSQSQFIKSMIVLTFFLWLLRNDRLSFNKEQSGNVIQNFGSYLS